MDDLYKDPKEVWKDDGEYLVYDKQVGKELGIIEADNGYKVSKNALVKSLQNYIINLCNKQYQGSLCKKLEKATNKLVKSLKKQIKALKLLNMEFWIFSPSTKIYEDIDWDFVQYVLKAELYKEWLRIDGILDEACEEYDNALAATDNAEQADEYYCKWIVHEIEHPGETKEQWEKRLEEDRLKEEEWNKQLKQWYNDHKEEFTTNTKE